MTYTLPTGDLMGTSLTHLSAYDDKVTVYGCDGITALFTFGEQVFKRTNKPDDMVCENYGVCDETLYFRFFIYDSQMKEVANTGLLSFFQSEFTLLDMVG